jgi:ABC-type phosphate transport system substrate-binding protein
MTLPPPPPRHPRWLGLLIAAAAIGVLVVACSLLLDRDGAQCSTNADCTRFGGQPLCMKGVCVATGLGPDGCFLGTPETPDQFANQCSVAQCEKLDNCARLGLCGPGATPPDPTPPPPPDAALPVDASTIDAPMLVPCVEAGVETVVVAGSTAIQPFLGVVAKLLAQGSPPYRIAYQPSGSCNGVDGIFDPAKRILRDIVGRPALRFAADGTAVPCAFGVQGAQLAVGVSDVFSTSCTAAFVPGGQIAEYTGPIQPMAFVVPADSSETAISAELGQIVFGRGGGDERAAPFSDPSLYFVRNATSGTQQMLARAINVDARRWWGVDRGGSTRVRDLLKAVAPASASKAIGILSTDFTDSERSRLRILAFKDRGQTCAYYPDSTLFARDKQNVRDGHYPIWGPVHFYTRVTGGVPSPAAAALLTRFSPARLDTPLLDAITDSGLVPSCAMKVQRTTEMGPLAAFSPQYQCGCYFDARVTGAAPASCKPCSGTADCPATAPACNNGYCEQR